MSTASMGLTLSVTFTSTVSSAFAPTDGTVGAPGFTTRTPGKTRSDPGLIAAPPVGQFVSLPNVSLLAKDPRGNNLNDF